MNDDRIVEATGRSPLRNTPQRHHRRSIRLRGYDYSQAGAYFVTVCTHNRECLFGEIVDGDMRMNGAGTIIRDEWSRTADMRSNVELDAFVVMPNHFHAIVFLSDESRRGDRPVAPTPMGPTPRSIGAIMAGFKSAATKRINEMRGTPGRPVWQRNYYEHVIRNDDEMNRAREYIINNPAKSALDRENPVGAYCIRPYNAIRPYHPIRPPTPEWETA
jgi:REP element-mobilizing transposase RayT